MADEPHARYIVPRTVQVIVATHRQACARARARFSFDDDLH